MCLEHTMAEASDSRSAPFVQRQKPHLPALYAAASSGVASPGRRNLLGALAAAPVAAVAPTSAEAIEDHPDYELLRLGAECMLSLRDWANASDELEDFCEQRYWAKLERFQAMRATTVAGLAMKLRIQFMRQCGDGWGMEAAIAMELTDEQRAQGDDVDIALFDLAQAARSVSDGRA